MSNLFQCITCERTLTSEESANHKCNPLIHKHKVIPATSYFTVVDANGITNVVIDGLDHIGYVFELKEPKIVPIDLPCDTINRQVTRRRSTDKGTAPKTDIFN